MGPGPNGGVIPLVKPFENTKRYLLPEFPRTPHLCSNTQGNDVTASPEEASTIFTQPLNIEEKVDGASVGITMDDHGDPVIRNRDHVLRKGYLKNTPAKRQFRPLWEWFYENQKRFQTLARHGRFAVYGDWMWMQHGLEYESLPDWLIAYDLYDQDEHQFVAPPQARCLLIAMGFTVPKLFDQITPATYEDIIPLTQTSGEWTKNHERIEGIYLKTYDDRFVTGRFKMVRPDFLQGALFDSKNLYRNTMRPRPGT